MTSEPWASCLDRLGAHLERQRRAVERGEPDAIVAFAPEQDLGPLPRRLLLRALELQAECAALEAELQAACARTSGALEAVARAATQSAGASYVDSRA